MYSQFVCIGIWIRSGQICKFRNTSYRANIQCLLFGGYTYLVRLKSRLSIAGPEEHVEAGEGDRPPDGEGVQGHGAGVGRHRRKVWPVLRARGGQLTPPDADRVQDALTAVEQNLLLVSRSENYTADFSENYELIADWLQVLFSGHS